MIVKGGFGILALGVVLGFLLPKHEYYTSVPDVEIVWGDARIASQSDGSILLDDVLFSGYLIEEYESGAMRSKKGYLDGELHGRYLTYYESGQLKEDRFYKDGEKHGKHHGYHPNGSKKFLYFFKDGLSIGTHYTWFENGDLATERNFKDGYEFGAQKVWRTDGKLRSNYVVKENGRKYGLLGVKRCTKIDSETGNLDPYTGTNEK